MPYSEEVYQKTFWFIKRAYNARSRSQWGTVYLAHARLVCEEALAHWKPQNEDDRALAIQLALLHGVLEDSILTYEFLEGQLGLDVAEGVLALSKDGTLPNEPPIYLQWLDHIKRIRQQPQVVWAVHMANWVVKLQQAPPKEWDKAQLELNLQEAIGVQLALSDACQPLSKSLLDQIEDYRVYLR